MLALDFDSTRLAAELKTVLAGSRLDLSSTMSGAL